MTRLRLACLPVVALACGWLGGDGRRLEVVDDDAVLSFAERIDGFYASLEDVPIDAMLTFEDAKLRDHFRDQAEFSDYYASLAKQVRVASFRNGSAERVKVREFRFEGSELARVEVTLVGRHQRGLRFWQIEVYRTDTWRLVEGAWVLTPEKL